MYNEATISKILDKKTNQNAQPVANGQAEAPLKVQQNSSCGGPRPGVPRRVGLRRRRRPTVLPSLSVARTGTIISLDLGSESESAGPTCPKIPAARAARTALRLVAREAHPAIVGSCTSCQ